MSLGADLALLAVATGLSPAVVARWWARLPVPAGADERLTAAAEAVRLKRPRRKRKKGSKT